MCKLVIKRKKTGIFSGFLHVVHYFFCHGIIDIKIPYGLLYRQQLQQKYYYQED